MSATPYFLGDHGSESARLEFQARAWRQITVDLCIEAGIAAGATVVDLGCGPGFFTFELASMVGGSGRVIAVDKSEEFLSIVRNRAERDARSVSVLAHDIGSAPLPIEDADFVFARWLDPYVDDLADLISKELACLREGGRVISLGTYHYRSVSMSPPSGAFDVVTDAIIEFYESNGQRISAGGLVPSILSAQGAEIVVLKDVSRIATPDDDLWEWYSQFSFSMLPRLLDAGLVRRGDVDAYAAAWVSRSVHVRRVHQRARAPRCGCREEVKAKSGLRRRGTAQGAR